MNLEKFESGFLSILSGSWDRLESFVDSLQVQDQKIGGGGNPGK